MGVGWKIDSETWLTGLFDPRPPPSNIKQPQPNQHREISDQYNANTYNLMSNNCNNCSNAVRVRIISCPDYFYTDIGRALVLND